ncbi:MAG TPA: sigma-70 family RNA polymerase sigma factor [Baekduia sp.]|uniref:sigma-70 family RNA polymerase sigma factor n=1 Tax=Baekduia sp. TaxID=2600305 RepID=UPI002D77B4FD|nr:sigma-70 family RNA polymerase sigma factor [Baekduia sp.]HET6506452.1 sigma-70 family RNA polymerase sigma factor [Baekduia sp.]
MDENDLLARRFEEHRGRLHAVARRMLGSSAEADDALQEAWLRTSRDRRDEVDDLGAWLTTVVSRVCLNMLDSRRRRREEALLDDGRLPEPTVVVEPEEQALAADAVGSALLVVLDQLSPPERLAFVLHDLFGLSFEEVAPIVDRTPAAARQLASRARRRVRGAEAPAGDLRRRRRAIVDAYLAAAREGDFDGLLNVLAPDVELRVDQDPAHPGAPLRIVRGAEAVARSASLGGRGGQAAGRSARRALIDGVPGAVVFDADGAPVTILAFAVEGERIARVDILLDPARVAAAVG